MSDKIKCFVGAVASWNGEMQVCVRVDEVHSYWQHAYNGAEERERLMLPAIFFRDLASGEEYKPFTDDRIKQFVLDAAEFRMNQKTVSETKTNEENNMAKKTKKTAVEEAGKLGKIERIDEMLLSGKFTKAEIAETVRAEYGMKESTSRNTVSWAASTMKGRIGRVSKHITASKAEKPASKPAKAKSSKAKEDKPAKVKRIPSRKTETVTTEVAAIIPEPAAV